MDQNQLNQKFLDAKKAIENNEVRQGLILILEILKADHTFEPAWSLFHKTMNSQKPLNEFKREMMLKFFPAKLHLLDQQSQPIPTTIPSQPNQRSPQAVQSTPQISASDSFSQTVNSPPTASPSSYPKFCTNCGNPIGAGHQFCFACGSAIKLDAGQSVQTRHPYADSASGNAAFFNASYAPVSQQQSSYSRVIDNSRSVVQPRRYWWILIPIGIGLILLVWFLMQQKQIPTLPQGAIDVLDSYGRPYEILSAQKATTEGFEEEWCVALDRAIQGGSYDRFLIAKEGLLWYTFRSFRSDWDYPGETVFLSIGCDNY